MLESKLLSWLGTVLYLKNQKQHLALSFAQNSADIAETDKTYSLPKYISRRNNNEAIGIYYLVIIIHFWDYRNYLGIFVSGNNISHA
jgi:hypothetical protein